MTTKFDSKKFWKYAGFYGILVLLAFLRALGTYVFIVPNAFAPGGVGGIASVVYNLVARYDLALADSWFNPAVTVFVLNLPLVIASFFVLSKQYSINSTIVVLFYSGFMALFSAVDFPVFRGESLTSGVVVLAAIAGGVLCGVSLGGTLLTNSSAGGTDIIGKIAYEKNPDVNVQWQIFIFDSIVVMFSGIMGLLDIKGVDSGTVFMNVATPILYSFITLFVTSEVADVVTNGLQSSVVFNIVTDKDKEIADAIVRELHRGATITRGEGVYTHTERHIVVCVVKRKQSTHLKRIIKKLDQNAFVFITKAKEVNGFGFRSGN